MNYKNTVLFCFLSLVIGVLIGYFALTYMVIPTNNQSYESPYVNLFTCPGECSDVILNLIKNSKHRIYCEMYHIDYNKYVDAFIEAKKRGVDVRIVVDKHDYLCDPKREYVCKYYRSAFEKMKENGIDIRYSDKFNLLHSKSCLFDNTLFVGSHNFTPTSALKNREINILTNSSKAIEEFLKIFESDFNSAKV